MDDEADVEENLEKKPLDEETAGSVGLLVFTVSSSRLFKLVNLLMNVDELLAMLAFVSALATIW